MTRYYKKYVEPILNGIGNDARNELAKNSLAQGFINKIRGPHFVFMNKEDKEMFVRNFYWCVVQLYTNTRFIHPTEGFGNKKYIPNDKPKYTDIYAKLNSETGKLNIPKRYHNIFKIVYNPDMGYVCRMRRKDKYPFYIIAKPEVRKSVRCAIQDAAYIPMHDIDKLLELWLFITKNSQIKSTAPKQPKENGRGHLSLAQEIWGEMYAKNRYLDTQKQINNITSLADAQERQTRLSLAKARREQAAAIENAEYSWNNNCNDATTLDTAKQVMESTMDCQNVLNRIHNIRAAAKQSIENIKMQSGLPFAKLRNHTR